MTTHLDYQLLLTLGKGFLLCAGLFALAACALRGRSAQTASLFWRGGMVALLALPIISFSFPWLPLIERVEGATKDAPVVEPSVTETGEGSSVSDPLALVEPAELPDALSPKEEVIEAAAPVPSNEELSEKEAPAPSVAGSEEDAAALPFSGIILGIWGTGLLGVFLGWVRSSGRLRRVSRRAAFYRDWNQDISRVSPKNIRVLLSEEVRTPLVWGILRPTILLPAEASEWSREQRQQVLAHELCHLRRRDPLFLLIARAALAIHWVNPLAWLVTRRLRLADERTADDAVLQSGSEPASYASLLASFARRSLIPAHAAAPSMASGSTVGVRVERILDGQQRRGAPRRWVRMLVWMLMITAVVLVGGLTTTVQAQEAPPASEPTKNEPSDKEATKTEEDANPLDEPADPGDEGTSALEPKESPALTMMNHKLKEITIPILDFDDTTLSESVDFIRMRARELDTFELHPDRAGINFVIIGDIGAKRLQNLKLRNIPLRRVLDFMGEQTGTSYEVGEFAVTFRAKGEAAPRKGAGEVAPATELLTKTYRVPPTFMAELNAEDDPFADTPPLVGLLKAAGIELDEGGAAKYIPATSKLIVVASPAQLELVDKLVESMTKGLPNVLKVRFELYEMDKVHALSVSKKDETQNHGAAAYKEVQALQKQGLAKLLMTPSIMTRPGHNAMAQSGSELIFIKDYQEKEGKDVPVKETVLVGSRILVEPNIGGDDATIDVRYSIYLSTGEPKRTTRRIKAPVSGDEVEVETVLLESLTLNPGGISTLTGQTQMLGTMRSSHPLKSSKEVVVFLTAHITKVAP